MSIRLYSQASATTQRYSLLLYPDVPLSIPPEAVFPKLISPVLCLPPSSIPRHLHTSEMDVVTWQIARAFLDARTETSGGTIFVYMSSWFCMYHLGNTSRGVLKDNFHFSFVGRNSFLIVLVLLESFYTEQMRFIYTYASIVGIPNASSYQ